MAGEDLSPSHFLHLSSCAYTYLDTSSLRHSPTPTLFLRPHVPELGPAEVA